MPLISYKLCILSHIYCSSNLLYIIGDSFNHAALKKGPFKCSKCDKSYSRKGSLTSHLKYDCGSEPQFPCTFCDRRYKRKPSLRMHLKTTHQIDQKQLDEHGAGN